MMEHLPQKGKLYEISITPRQHLSYWKPSSLQQMRPRGSDVYQNPNADLVLTDENNGEKVTCMERTYQRDLPYSELYISAIMYNQQIYIGWFVPQDFEALKEL